MGLSSGKSDHSLTASPYLDDLIVQAMLPTRRFKVLVRAYAHNFKDRLQVRSNIRTEPTATVSVTTLNKGSYDESTINVAAYATPSARARGANTQLYPFSSALSL